MINSRQDELKEEKARPDADWKCIFTQEDVMKDPVTVGNYTYDRTQIVEYFNLKLVEWEAGLQGDVPRNDKGEIDYGEFKCSGPYREQLPSIIDYAKNNHKRPTLQMTPNVKMQKDIAAWQQRIATGAAPYIPSQEELFAEVKKLNQRIVEHIQQIQQLTKRIASEDNVRSTEQQVVDATIATAAPADMPSREELFAEVEKLNRITTVQMQQIQQLTKAIASKDDKQQPNVRSLDQRLINEAFAENDRIERERRDAVLRQVRLGHNVEHAAALLEQANLHLIAKELDTAESLANSIIVLDLPTPQKHEFLIDVYCILIEKSLLQNQVTIANRNVGLADDARRQCHSMPIVTLPFETSLRHPILSAPHLRLARLNLLVGRVKLLNEVYQDTNAVQQAVAIFAHYKKEKELIEALILLGMIYLKNKQDVYAQDQFTQAQIIIGSNEIGDYSLLEAGLGEICRLYKNDAQKAKEHYEKAIAQAEKNQNKLAAIIAQHGLAKLISTSKAQNVEQEVVNRFTKLIKQYENREYDLANIIGQQFVENGYSLSIWAYFICGSNNYLLGQFKEALENLDSLFKKLNYYKSSSDDWRAKDYPGFLHYAFSLRARIYAEHPELFVPENDLQTKDRLSEVIHQTNLMLEPEEIKEASRDALIHARTARAAAYLQQGKLQKALNDYDHLINEKQANQNHERAKVYLAFALQELEPQKKLAYLMQATQDCSAAAKNASSWMHADKISARETLCKAINQLLNIEGNAHARQVKELLKDVSSWPVSEPSYKAARICLATAHLQAQVADTVEAKKIGLPESERISFVEDIHLLAKQLVDIAAHIWMSSDDVANNSGNMIKDGLQAHTSERQRYFSKQLTAWVSGVDLSFKGNASAKQISQLAFKDWINFINDAVVTQQKNQVVVASGNGFFSNSSSPSMLAPTTTKQALTNNN